MNNTHMSDLCAADFDEFFAALWGKPPFAWQKDLAARVLEHGDSAAESPSPNAPCDDDAGCDPWPAAIALPTAAGKTACMDIAVFALAAQAKRLATGQSITAPRRIFFVVDRRIIVDEAYKRARRLQSKLCESETGILGNVAANLRRIVHGESAGFSSDEPSLSVHALRGGMYRSESWARNPLQPTVVACTVDQLGSRLLFRAYGRGSGTWPIYAGLAVNDSLILLDEAHCAQPFLQTLRAVRRFRTWARVPLARCFHPVVMSATPPADLTDVFRDTSGEGRDPGHPLGKRQLASKPAKLVDPVAKDDLPGALAQAAQELLGDGRHAVVVFANRVATARETSRLLAEERQDVETILLTGRMRPVDKDAVAQRLDSLDLHSERSSTRVLEKPVIVVATQTLEVGADLDFDGLVAENASLDALRQRFGRLDRMGRDIAAQATILVRADQARLSQDDEGDPVYGKALTKTWNWLDRHKNENGEVDFGIAELEALLPDDHVLAELNAPSPDAPVMLPAHIDCWAQTAPEPRPSPDVAPFLHGPREGAPDVQVCWRADLDLVSEDGQEHAIESLLLCPPGSNETLPVPIGVFKRWLAGTGVEDHDADLEGGHAAERDEDVVDSREATRRVIRWHGADTNHDDVTSDPGRIRPGDVVVVPTRHPSLPGQLGDFPPEATEPPAALDVGDQAHRVARAKPILRLHPAIVRVWPDSMMAKQATLDLLDDVERKFESDPDEVADTVRDLLTEVSETEAILSSRWSWLPKAAGELKAEFSVARLRREVRLVGRSLILAGRRRVPALAHEADPFNDEDDATASGISHPDGQPVLLCKHLPGVEDYARRHAVGCGLPEDVAEAVARAGLLHDVGKADPRFQSLLRGGTLSSGPLLAKSAQMPRTHAARRRARAASGYPERGRHELLSVRLVESAPTLLPNDDILRDLVLHLVASHHGHCRPFAPVVVDNPGAPVAFDLCGHRMEWSGATGLERLDSGVAERYWRLVRHYGWWGLAWLEALLRLADWRRSEWEGAHDAEQ